jgi:hypothetical protein
MLVKSLIRSLEKAGFKVERNPKFESQYVCYGNLYICSFFQNGGGLLNAVAVNVRRIVDEHDSMSDYHAGFYPRNIKTVVEYLKK